MGGGPACFCFTRSHEEGSASPQAPFIRAQVGAGAAIDLPRLALREALMRPVAPFVSRRGRRGEGDAKERGVSDADVGAVGGEHGVFRRCLNTQHHRMRDQSELCSIHLRFR